MVDQHPLDGAFERVVRGTTAQYGSPRILPRLGVVSVASVDEADLKEGPRGIDLVRAISNEERLDRAVSISPLTATTRGQTTTDDRADSDRSMGIAASDPPERLRRGRV